MIATLIACNSFLGRPMKDTHLLTRLWTIGHIKSYNKIILFLDSSISLFTGSLFKLSFAKRYDNLTMKLLA